MHDSATGDWPYRLQAPAVPEAIAWARTFAASLATSLGVDSETSADLRLTISELVSDIVVTNPGGLMTINARDTNGHLVLAISPWAPRDVEGRQLTAWDIASSLFEVQPSGDSIEVHLNVDPARP